MKNKLLTVLLILTALFAGLTLGLYLGRNPAGGSVTVSILSLIHNLTLPTILRV